MDALIRLLGLPLFRCGKGLSVDARTAASVTFENLRVMSHLMRR